MKADNIIGPVTIELKPERSYVGIKLETPFGGMFAEITRALKELRKWVKENKIHEGGPFFVRYYHCDMEATMVVEVGLITQDVSITTDRIQAGILPSGQYATMIYRGNGLRGNQALMKWAKDQGKVFDPIDPTLRESYVCRYEAYLTDYRAESRKLLWDVELSIKLVDPVNV